MLQVINFGKHRGKTWDEVMIADRGYLEWALKEIPHKIPANFRKAADGPMLRFNESLRGGLNNDQRQIVDLLLEGKNVIAPGIPGSGKSYIAKNFEGSIVALAPTGVAAINIGGQTFHSYFRISPSDLLHTLARPQPIPKSALWILDEVFYTSATTILKVIEYIISNSEKAQFLLLGDPMQLRPVERRDASSQGDTEYDADEKKQIKELKQWKGKNVFDVLHELDIAYNIVKLETSVRHKEAATFDFMKNARCASLTPKQLKSIPVKTETPDNCIVLAYTNEQVDTINRAGLAQFDKLTGVKITKHITNLRFPGQEITANFINNYDTNQGHRTLLLKKLKYYTRNFQEEITAIGARVMVTKNIKSDGGHYNAVNGDTGILIALTDKRASVMLDRTKKLIDVDSQFEGYTDRDKIWKIGITRIPIRTCYAVTIHKSQGMTIASDLHIILNDKMAEHTGLLYTGITRTTDVARLSVSAPLTNKMLAYDKKLFKLFQDA